MELTDKEVSAVLEDYRRDAVYRFGIVSKNHSVPPEEFRARLRSIERELTALDLALDAVQKRGRFA